MDTDLALLLIAVANGITAVLVTWIAHVRSKTVEHKVDVSADATRVGIAETQLVSGQVVTLIAEVRRRIDGLDERVKLLERAVWHGRGETGFKAT